MKPNKRAVRCADEELAENDPQILNQWLDLDQEQTRNMRPRPQPHRQGQGQAEEHPQEYRQPVKRAPIDMGSASGKTGREAGAQRDRIPKKTPANDNQPDGRTPDRRSPRGENSQTGRETDATGIGTVTQITPDDILAEEGPIAPCISGGVVTAEEVKQDVVTINPSIDSMESRG